MSEFRIKPFIFAALSLGACLNAASMDFLNLSPGAASSGRGGASVAETGSLEGLFQNPASLAFLQTKGPGLAALAAYDPREGGQGVYRFAVSGGFQSLSLALGIHGIRYPNLIGGLEDALSVGREIELSSYAAHAALAVPIALGKSRLDLGTKLAVAEQSLDGTKYSTLSLDVGSILNIPLGKNGNLAFAAAVRNLSLQQEGRSGSLTLPILFCGGIAGEVFFENVSGGKTFSLKALADADLSLENDPVLRLGGEAWLLGKFGLRGGFSGGREGFKFQTGAGLRLTLLGVEWDADYSFLPFGNAGPEHHLQLMAKLPLGKILGIEKQVRGPQMKVADAKVETEANNEMLSSEE
ncbi:MAG: hypothetical protein JNM63_07865 [Spirochaetia bacterium]|nr:hypothetical protein [Spirochaetia bacterium]